MYLICGLSSTSFIAEILGDRAVPLTRNSVKIVSEVKPEFFNDYFIKLNRDKAQKIGITFVVPAKVQE